MTTSGPGHLLRRQDQRASRRDGRARAARRCASAAPTAACWRNGAMTSSRPCRRRTTCCGSASSAIRCWRGSRCATRHWPPRSTSSRCRSTAAAAANGACAGRSCSGRVAATASLLARRGRGRAGDRHRASRRWFPTRSSAGSARPIDAQVRALARHRPARRRIRMRQCRAARSGPRGVRQADAPTRDGGRACRIPLRPAVMRRPEANAVALPGGRIYVFQGLIDKAETPGRARRRHRPRDRPCRAPRRHPLGAAGRRPVVAVRHAARRFRRRRRGRDRRPRPSCRRAIRARSRAAADLYGVMLMTKLGGDPRALGRHPAAHRRTHPSGNRDPARSSRNQGARDQDQRGGRHPGRRGRCSTARNGPRSSASARER